MHSDREIKMESLELEIPEGGIMKRRTFIQKLSALGTWMGMEFKATAGDGSDYPSEPSPAKSSDTGESPQRYTLETLGEVLGFDAGTGQLVSFHSRTAEDQEF